MMAICWASPASGVMNACARSDATALRATASTCSKIGSHTRSSARYALITGSAASTAARRSASEPTARCRACPLRRIPRRKARMARPASAKVATTTSSRTQSSTPMSTSEAATMTTETGIAVTATSLTARSCAASEVARATRSPAPRARTSAGRIANIRRIIVFLMSAAPYSPTRPSR